MLAAETPSVDGHLAASTPRRRGMDCKSSKNANKKLIQARLPFKRMNPEPKENQPPKRPCAHTCPKPGDSDRENENESSALSAHCGPPLVNGRGPLDGFLSRRRPAPADENMVIDLTADNALSPIKRLVSPATTSSRLPAKDKHLGKDKTTLSEKSSSPKTHTLDCTVVETDEEEDEDEEDEEMEEEEEEEANLTASVSQIDTTQDSESEPEELEESGNRSMLSASSASGTSESSPEKSKTDDPTSPSTPSTEPKTTPKIPSDQKNIRRRSLKKVQEQEERHLLRQEKDRQREEAKAAKEKKKEEARRLKEEREKEKRERKEKDEQEKREKKEKEEKEKADKLKAKEDLRKSKQEAKLEEKRKKEEEKQMKEEEKRLKEEKDRVKAGKAEITRFLQKSKIQQAPKSHLSGFLGLVGPELRGPSLIQSFSPFRSLMLSSPSVLSRLLPLLHGNTNSSKVIISEFQEFCRQPTTSSSSSPPELSSPQSQAENIPTRIQVKRLMKSNAAYEKRSTYRRCWYVQAEVLTRFGQDALPVPCQWTYLTTGAREESREEPQAATGSQGNSPTTPQNSSSTSSSSNKRKSTGSMSITKFMKKCADPEQAIEADGFQADTEEDDEEDCVIVSTKTGELHRTNIKLLLGTVVVYYKFQI
ncbi:chromatin assembly factor 1 subunit A [Notothenia coriiceps]|uniref:Chromatin assembly factor 1 subunit A n=1 Tax=Notothenia coriiceps TaxID=8208 RepID=A0A6I9NKH5_9TELE|nr:PREDICTED: chromatin assembly factor 1 subunit A [Notothenia coriiceps]